MRWMAATFVEVRNRSWPRAFVTIAPGAEDLARLKRTAEVVVATRSRRRASGWGSRRRPRAAEAGNSDPASRKPSSSTGVWSVRFVPRTRKFHTGEETPAWDWVAGLV